jgi:N-glycosylase/DNA lyase
VGYRAAYLRDTAALVAARGGEAWLLGLRTQDRVSARSALLTCPGVGLKVADCVALFALDQREALPVDTHVWHIAYHYLDKGLADVKSITPVVYDRIGDLFRTRYVSHAGWAHSLLFAAELPAFRPVLPPHILQQMEEIRQSERTRKAEVASEKRAKKAAKTAAAVAGDDDDASDAEAAPAGTEAKIDASSGAKRSLENAGSSADSAKKPSKRAKKTQ